MPYGYTAPQIGGLMEAANAGRNAAAAGQATYQGLREQIDNEQRAQAMAQRQQEEQDRLAQQAELAKGRLAGQLEVLGLKQSQTAGMLDTKIKADQDKQDKDHAFQASQKDLDRKQKQVQADAILKQRDAAQKALNNYRRESLDNDKGRMDAAAKDKIYRAWHDKASAADSLYKTLIGQHVTLLGKLAKAKQDAALGGAPVDPALEQEARDMKDQLEQAKQDRQKARTAADLYYNLKYPS